MDRYSGCGCCEQAETCVDLTVDNDQSSMWERVDAAGVSTVTVLESVPLCRFRLKLTIDQPDKNFNGGYDSAWEGSLTIYLLADPSDGDGDAIGTITLTNRNAWTVGSPPYSRAAGAPLPFYFPTDGIYSSSYGDSTTGDGEIDISDMGFSAVEYKHDSLDVAEIDIYSFADVLVVQGITGPSGGIFYHSDGTVGGTDALGVGLVLTRSSCADQDVYLRYQTDDDFDIDTTGVKFTLQTLNTIGDVSCRTGLPGYDEEPESGSCSSPPTLCDKLAERSYPFAKIAFDLDDVPNGIGVTKDIDTTLWVRGTTGCTARIDWQENSFNDFTVYLRCDMVFVCDGDAAVINVSFYYGQGGFGVTTLAGTWEIELSPTVTHSNQIPTTVLNEANSTFYDLAFDAVLTVN